MSDTPVPETTYAAFEKTAQLVGAACSRDKVMPILTAYGDSLAEAGIVFAVLSGASNEGELDYTIALPPGTDDPYGVALSNGLVTKTDHPTSTLLPSLQEHLSLNEYLVDAGVAGGFKKIYAHFPQNVQKASTLADIPSMPPAVAENASFLARHGLEEVAMIAIDYGRHTMNLYFRRSPNPLEPPPFERESILSMVRGARLSEPSERALEFARGAFRVNVTFSWSSPKIVRIALARFPRRSLDPSVLSDQIEPKFEQFLKGAPHTYTGENINLLGLKWTGDEEILEFASYYQLSPIQRGMWKAAYNEEV